MRTWRPHQYRHANGFLPPDAYSSGRWRHGFELQGGAIAAIAAKDGIWFEGVTGELALAPGIAGGSAVAGG